MIKAVIFDLDGTLIDSAPDIHAAANRMLADFGKPPLDLPTITSFIGNGLPKLAERAATAAGLSKDDFAQAIAKTGIYYGENPTTLTQTYAGILPLLSALRDRGIKIGLCTNKPYDPAIACLNDFDILPFFDAVVAGDTLDVKKPDAAPLLKTIEMLGETEVLYVGDSAVDYDTAKNANVPFAFFTGGYRTQPDEFFQECWHFDHFDQLRLRLVPPRAYLFDVDGTLAETEEVHRNAFNAAFDRAGLGWQWSRDEYRDLLKTSGGKERIKKHTSNIGSPDVLSDQQIKDLHHSKTEIYRDLANSALTPRDGVMALIEWARRTGVTLAICTTTSRSNIDALVKRFWNCAPEDIFAGIYCAETAPQKKPDPQVYCQALDDLGFSAQDALAFEDSHNGLTAARRAGLDVIVTPAIYTSHEDHGDATDCLTDLTQFMRKYCDAT